MDCFIDTFYISIRLLMLIPFTVILFNASKTLKNMYVSSWYIGHHWIDWNGVSVGVELKHYGNHRL